MAGSVARRALATSAIAAIDAPIAAAFAAPASGALFTVSVFGLALGIEAHQNLTVSAGNAASMDALGAIKVAVAEAVRTGFQATAGGTLLAPGARTTFILHAPQ